MRQVVLGHGLAASLPLHARLVHILSMLGGAVLAGLLACFIRTAMDWVETHDSIYLTAAGYVFALPLLLPKMTHQDMVLSVTGVALLSMGIGVGPATKIIVLGCGCWHGTLAHDEFDAWLAKRPKDAPAFAQAPSPAMLQAAAAAETQAQFEANMPFIRLGASMGLGAAGILDPNAVLILSLLVFVAGLIVASVVYRRWHSEQQAIAEQALEKQERDEAAMAEKLDDQGQSELSRAVSRREAGRARRAGAQVSDPLGRPKES